MKRLFCLLCLIGALAACSMPTTTVRSVDTRPGLIIANAPEGATVLVDGISVGAASEYNGEPNHLLVDPGTHRITVRQGNAVIYDQQIFVDTEIKRISVR